MMASISTQYYQILLSQGVCSAIGVSLIFQPANSVIPSWFDKKRGAAYGIVTSGSSIGGVVFPIMIQRLIPLVGFGWAMRSAAFLILALLLVANLTIRSRTPPAPHNLGPEGLVAPLKDANMMLLTFGFVLLTFGIFVPINYLVVEAVAAGGVKPQLAQYLIAVLNAGRYVRISFSLIPPLHLILHRPTPAPIAPCSTKKTHHRHLQTNQNPSLFGRLGAGATADIIGPYNVFVGVCYLTSILILGLWIPASTPAAIIVFAAVFGFASGAYVALAAPCVVQISPYQQIGYRVGLVFLFSSVAGLTTNPIAGAILAREHGGWMGVKVFAGVLAFAGTTLALGARLHQSGLRFLAKV